MEKVQLAFPNIHKGIKKSKDHPETAPYNYVTIFQQHAIIVTPYSVICLNIEDYFLNYHTIHEEQKVGFRQLMIWLEGKHFTTEFWDYLTTKNEIIVIDDNRINVSGDCFQKELVYEHKEVVFNNALQMIKQNFSDGKVQISSTAISNNILKTIDTTVGKLVGPNALIFEFNSLTSSTIRFTVQDMSFIFGIFLSSNDCLSKPFNFEHFNNFCKLI